MSNIIVLGFVIGHTAALKQKPDIFGFTHDWQLFVKAVNNQNDGGNDMSHFIDKIVFHLHNSFPKPKRVLKEAPFIVKESGYAGFELAIDIYFKNENKDDPKKVTFSYDLDLQPFKSEIKEHCVENCSDDFKRKCIKGGCVLADNSNSSSEYKNKEYRAAPSSQSIDSSKKIKKSDEGKSKKDKTYFEELFGDPIEKTSTKVSSKPSADKQQPPQLPPQLPPPAVSKDKDKSKSSKHSDSKSSQKTDDVKISSKGKDKSRDRERSDKKDKSAKRAASPVIRNMPNTDFFKSHAKPTQPVIDQQSSPSVKKSKKKSNEKEREKSDKKESKSKDKDKVKVEVPAVSSKKSHEASSSSSKTEVREKTSKSGKNVSPPVATATMNQAPQPAESHKKEKKEKEGDREHKHKKKTKSKDKEKKDRTKSPKSQSTSAKSKYGYSGDSDNNEQHVPTKKQPPPQPIVEVVKKKPSDKEEKSRKRPAPKEIARDSTSPPPQKVAAFENPPVVPEVQTDTKITTEYLQELKELKHKITTIKANENLQQIIRLIASSGNYEITKTTFDFDLVRLDKSTIQRLQDFFSN